MNEDRYRDKLGDYVDGSLSGPERQGLEAHLETCESCRGMAKDLLEIKRAAGSLERVTPPESVWGRIADSIHGQDVHDSHNWKTGSTRLSTAMWSHRWALAATIVLLIGALGVMNKLDFFSSDAPPKAAPSGSRQSSGPRKSITRTPFGDWNGSSRRISPLSIPN